MGNRLQLHQLLKDLLGSSNVYFQPPENIVMQYPCIVYKRYGLKTTFANDNPYYSTKEYQVTIIDQNPDSEIVDKVSKLLMSSFITHFTSDNLNHDIYNIYF